MLDVLLRFLLVIALIVILAVLIVHSQPSHPVSPPQRPEHPLFHFWVTGRGRGWVRDSARYDECGNYFFRDLYVNVAALGILGKTGVLPLGKAGIDAGPDYAFLFERSEFAVRVEAQRDTLIVILADRSQIRLELQPGDVESMAIYVDRAMDHPSARPFSIVRELYNWALEHSRTKLADFLATYRDECDPTSAPAPPEVRVPAEWQH